VADRPVLEEHTLLLLVRPLDAPEVSDEEAEALQQQHLAFLQEKRDEGVMAAAGPFRGQPDERWRGLCLYLVPPDRAHELAQDDPLVRAGRLTTQVWTWFTRPGELGIPPTDD
jgi:uncharacterized protein